MVDRRCVAGFGGRISYRYDINAAHLNQNELIIRDFESEIIRFQTQSQELVQNTRISGIIPLARRGIDMNKIHRQHCCCFTGHRPEKLHRDAQGAITALATAIDRAIAEGYTTFISGMAKGIDIWAAEIVLNRRAQNPEIKLICAVPYPGFELGRKDEWTERILRIMFEANSVKFVREKYSRSVFQIRNIWMVDHSSLLIAAYDGEAGGTKNTIDYALREGHCQIQYI